MNQSRLMSFFEAATNTSVGYLFALGTQLVVFPFYGLDVSLSQNLLIGLAFTMVSLGRSYTLRRLFERWRRRPSPAPIRTSECD